MATTKSSFPDIFKNQSRDKVKIQKQEKEFSLYLRSNSFDFNKTKINLDNTQKANVLVNRKRSNRSLNDIYTKHKIIDQNQTRTTFRLTSRNQTFSKTRFIQQKQAQNAQQMDSFKTVRKNVVQQIVLVEKCLQIVSQQQKHIKNDFQQIKHKYLEKLDSFTLCFIQKINELDKSLKICRRESANEQKTIKKQYEFLKQEIQVSKSIIANFEIQQQKLRYQLTNH